MIIHDMMYCSVQTDLKGLLLPSKHKLVITCTNYLCIRHIRIQNVKASNIKSISYIAICFKLQ